MAVPDLRHVDAGEYIRRAATLALAELAARRSGNRPKRNLFTGEPNLYWRSRPENDSES